jgi:BMFP domain-containing protein YqiC
MRRDAAQPSYEEVVAENAALYQRIAELEAALEQLIEDASARETKPSSP